MSDKPLDNVKHELFANELVKSRGNASKAYAKVYKEADTNSIAPSASRLLTNGKVKDRIAVILEKHNLSLDDLTHKLKEHVLSDDDRISMDAVKTSYKLHKVLGNETSNNEEHRHVHIHSNERYSSMSAIELLEHIRSTFT